MATYRIGLEPPSIPRSALPPRRRWPRAMAVVIAAAIMAGVVGAAAGLAFRLSAPERAGQQFLECWERGDLAGVAAMLDDRYQDLLAPRGTALLEALHAKLPRRFRVEVSGYPDVPGGFLDRARYHLRVAFADAEAGRAAGPAFILTLAQRPDGGWRVAFLPTYRSLFVARFGDEGERFFRQRLAARVGTKPWQLDQWSTTASPATPGGPL